MQEFGWKHGSKSATAQSAQVTWPYLPANGPGVCRSLQEFGWNTALVGTAQSDQITWPYLPANGPGVCKSLQEFGYLRKHESGSICFGPMPATPPCMTLV